MIILRFFFIISIRNLQCSTKPKIVFRIGLCLKIGFKICKLKPIITNQKFYCVHGFSL